MTCAKQSGIVKQYQTTMIWWEVDSRTSMLRSSRVLTFKGKPSERGQLDIMSVSGVGMVPTGHESGIGDTVNIETNRPLLQNLRQKSQDNPTTDKSTSNRIRLDRLPILLISKPVSIDREAAEEKALTLAKVKDTKRERQVVQNWKMSAQWASTQSVQLGASAPSSSKLNWSN